jgi:hypothetical protein
MDVNNCLQDAHSRGCGHLYALGGTLVGLGMAETAQRLAGDDVNGWVQPGELSIGQWSARQPGGSPASLAAIAGSPATG